MITRFIPFAVDVEGITEVGKSDRYAQKKLSQSSVIGKFTLLASGFAVLYFDYCFGKTMITNLKRGQVYPHICPRLYICSCLFNFQL